MDARNALAKIMILAGVMIIPVLVFGLTFAGSDDINWEVDWRTERHFD